MDALLWGLLGIILVITQFTSDQTEFLFPALGAFLVSLLTLIPGVSGNFFLQFLLWGGLSIFSLLFLRKRFKKIFEGKQLREDREEFAGHTARVIEAITPQQPGRISFQGTTWMALSLTESIPVGAEVMILQKEDLHFVVTKNEADQRLLRKQIDDLAKEE